MKTKNLVIIIPTYNEADNINKIITEINKILPEGIIFVIDDSTDGTNKKVKLLAKKYKNIKLWQRKSKKGRGSAVIFGFKQALKNPSIKYFVEMDADFSHDPKYLKIMIETSKKADIVIGSRYLPESKLVGRPWYRRLISLLANLIADSLFRIGLTDYTNGYRLYTRRAIRNLSAKDLSEKGYILLSEIAYVLYKKGFKFAEIPITYIERSQGESTFNLKEFIDALMGIVRIYFRHKNH